jgi:hypothetical protein
MDNYVKRLATALEDDFKTQFYDPAFRGVRRRSRPLSRFFSALAAAFS